MQISEPLTDACSVCYDAITMARLKGAGFTGFLTGAGSSVCLWAFPESQLGQVAMQRLAHPSAAVAAEAAPRRKKKETPFSP